MVALVLVMHLVSQDTYAELELPKDKARRASMLLKFAENADASIADRLRALKGASEQESKRTAAAILEAKIHGAVGKKGPRASAWMKAAANAKKRGDPGHAAYIDRARDGDDALIAFAKFVSRAPAASDAGVDPVEAKHLEDIERAIDAWTRLGDHRAVAEA